MWRFLVALGGFTTIAGLLSIVLGSSVFITAAGNALIATGATGFTGGLIIAAAGFILRQLERISDVLEQGAAFAPRPEPARRETPVAEAAVLAVSEAVVAEVPPARPEAPPAAPPDLPEPKLDLPEPAPAVPDAPAPRPRALSFADRLRPPPALPPETPAAEVPVAERRGRILPRPGEAEPVPGTLRPRSLLDRMAPARPVAERPAPPPLDVPAPAPEPAPEPEPAPVEPPAPEPVAPPELPPVEPIQAPERVPAPPRPAPAAPAPRLGPEPVVLKSGIVGGMAYTLYSDGSIQAELPDGVVRFGSLQELREHVARSAQPPAQ